jgi:hypothetical protein
MHYTKWVYQHQAFIQPILLQKLLLLLLLSKLIKTIRYYGYDVGKFIQIFADLESLDQMIQNLDDNISNLEQKLSSVLECYFRMNFSMTTVIVLTGAP